MAFRKAHSPQARNPARGGLVLSDCLSRHGCGGRLLRRRAGHLGRKANAEVDDTSGRVEAKHGVGGRAWAPPQSSTPAQMPSLGTNTADCEHALHTRENCWRRPWHRADRPDASTRRNEYDHKPMRIHRICECWGPQPIHDTIYKSIYTTITLPTLPVHSLPLEYNGRAKCPHRAFSSLL